LGRYHGTLVLLDPHPQEDGFAGPEGDGGANMSERGRFAR
jgi:hypothetical protein